MLFGNQFPTLAIMIVDIAFLPCLFFFIARPVIAAKHTRSIALLIILAVLTGCNLLFHLGWAGYLPITIVPLALQVTVDMITLLMIILGGRVIPFFTHNALPQINIHQSVWLDRLAIAAVIMLFIAEAIPSTMIFVGPIGLAAGGLNLIRLLGWGGYKTLSQPILWVLHLGYLWICAGLMTKGIDAYLPGDYRSIATHLLTVGAMSTLILGMTSRVSLGHTGRRLELPQGMSRAYLLLALATIARISAPLLPHPITTAALFYLLDSGLLLLCFFILLYSYLMATKNRWAARINKLPNLE